MQPLTAEQKAAQQRIAKYMQMEEAPCLCGHMAGWDFQTHDRHMFALRLRLCTQCGIIRSNPRPSEESLARYYAEDFRTMYSPKGCEDIFQQQQGQGQQGKEILRNLPAHVVVDVGCGCAGNLEPFYADGAFVMGCDFDQDYLDYGKSRMPEGALLINGPSTKLPQGEADIVIAWHTLEHRPDWEQAMSEHASLLNKTGVLWAQIPALSRIRSHYRDPNQYLCLPHIWHFSDRSFLWALQRFGFDGVVTQEGTALVRYTGRTAEPDPHEAERALTEWLGAEREWQRQIKSSQMLKGE